MKIKPTGRIGKSSTSKKAAKKEFSKGPDRATKKEKAMIIPASNFAQGPAKHDLRLKFLRNRARAIVAKARVQPPEEPLDNVVSLMKSMFSDLKTARTKMAIDIRRSVFRKLPGFLAEHAKKKVENWGEGSSYSYHAIAQSVLDFLAFLLALEAKGAINLALASTQAKVIEALASWQEAPGGGRHFFMNAYLEKPAAFAPKAVKPVRRKKADPDDYSERIMRAPGDGFFNANRGPKDGKSYRKWKRKVNAVRRAYEKAPAGSEAIARAVIRKLKEVSPGCGTDTAMDIVWGADCIRPDVRSRIHSYFYQFDVDRDNAARRRDDERRAANQRRKKAA